MTAKKHQSIITLFLILVLCINLANVELVHADGETPTESPAPTQVETEPPTEPPVEPTSTPVEATPTAEAFEATPTPEAVAQENVPAATELPQTVAELPQTLENTDIVVLDEQGQSLVLGSQETANALAGSDPVWCPESVSIPTPGANGCSTSFASITELLLAMQTDPQSFSQNGTIFLEQTDGEGFTAPLLLDDSNGSLGSSFSSLNLYNLTIQGGWNPATGSTSGQTNFSGSNAQIQVGSLTSPWIGSVTINNLTLQNAISTTNASLAVSSGGIVEMNNVIVVGSGTGQNAIDISASDVALTDVSASDSDMNGISITASSAGTVTLNNVVAQGNGHTNGSEPFGSGVYISGADTLVIVSGGSFDNNALYGIQALNSTSTTLPAANLWTDQDDYAPGSVVTITGNDNNLNGNNIGFTPGETVMVVVQGPNGYTATCEVVADSYGAWDCQITLWASDLAIGSYTYTATGLTSGVFQSGTFTDGNATVTGTVKDTNGNPISGATVSCTSGCTGSATTTTNASGNYSFSGGNRLNFGGGSATLTLTASKTGYTSQSLNLSVSSNGTYTLNFTLTISDSTAPSIAANVIGTPGSNGWHTSDVTVSWNVSDPESGIASSSGCGPTTSTTETTGTTLTCTATNGAGLSNSVSVTIKIDKTPPLLTLPSNITAEATSASGAAVSYSASVTDNLDLFIILNCSPASGSTFSLGTTTVNCSSTDAAGNTASGSFQVTVIDSAGPVIAPHPDETVEATSASGAVVTYTSPTTFDAVDGPGIASCSPSSGEGFPLGDITVTCNAVDSLGHPATPTTFVAHVVDTTGPVIAAHLDVTVEATSGAGALVTYTHPSASDIVDGLVTVTCLPASGTTFPLGDTTVTCTASDSHGNPATPSTFVVHVVDTTAPVLASHADVTVEATSPAGAVVTYTSPSASDTVDGAVTVTCFPASGTTFSVGNTAVTCNAMDLHGNPATPTTFTVHVVDTTAPVLTLPGNITVNATSSSGAVVTYSASANDIVDGSVLVNCVPPSGFTFPLGPTTVDCSATDSHGNTSTGSFIVNVQDPGGPIITLPANITAEATGPAGAVVSYTAFATDLADGTVQLSCDHPSGSSFPFGTTEVKCSATDSDGNTNTAAFLVTVQDTTAPAIAPHSSVTTSTSDPSGVIVNYSSPSTYDAVDGIGVASCSPAAGSLFPIGDTQVTCTATDSHGNSATSTFFIHVKPTQTSPAPSPSGSPSSSPSIVSGLIVPITGGGLIDLDCNTILWAFGIKFSFFNLCDQQTAINSVGASDVPAELPDGFSFVMGLDVQVLSENQIIKNLPDGSGIEMDFPIYKQSRDEFTVLYWSDDDGDGNGEWVEISQQLSPKEISKTLSTATGDELYRLVESSGSQSLTDLFYQILTTDKTGIFVIVKK